MKKNQPRRRPQKPKRRKPAARPVAAGWNPYKDPQWGPVMRRHDAMPENRGRFDIIDEYVTASDIAEQIDYWEAFYAEIADPDAFNESIEDADQEGYDRLHIEARAKLSDHVQQLGRRRDEIVREAAKYGRENP